MFLINGKAEADASNLLENDTVLIYFRGMGFSRRAVDILPQCWHNTTVRTGCGIRYMCGSGLSWSFFYYFRPVLMSDNRFNIKFVDKNENIKLSSVTLSGKYEC